MSESRKAVLALLLCILVIATLFVFFISASERKPQPWIALAILSTASLTVLSILIWATTRKDKLPDFLRQLVKRPFERHGLCFTIVPRVQAGTCYLSAYFQNRYTGGLEGVIVLQPAQQFWLNRHNVATVRFSVACPGGGFGVVTIPWAVPAQYQGKVQALEVAADVRYPQGRGRMVRFRDSLHVGSAGTDWGRIALTVGAMLTGHIVLSKPARFRFTLPSGVREEIPAPAVLPVEILWQPGQPDGESPAPADLPAETVGIR